MKRAYWKGVLLAECEQTVVVEGNHYFPISCVKLDYFKESQTKTVCSWKGTASYYDIDVDGEINKDAAWFYEEPFDKASMIKGYVAFWKGVEIEQ